MNTLEVLRSNPQEDLPGYVPAMELATAAEAECSLSEKQLQTARLNDLATRAQQGDTAAFGTLYAETSGALEAFLRTRTDPYTAQDITQTAFLKAFEKLDTFNGVNFKSWLYTIAVHSHLDTLRRNKHISIFDAETVCEEQPDPTDNEAIVNSRVDAPTLLAQAALSEEQKTVVLLVRAFGLSAQEAASKLGINEKTVRTRVFRAEKSLRKHYSAV